MRLQRWTSTLGLEKAVKPLSFIPLQSLYLDILHSGRGSVTEDNKVIPQEKYAL